jgi:hypothetical protein
MRLDVDGNTDWIAFGFYFERKKDTHYHISKMWIYAIPFKNILVSRPKVGTYSKGEVPLVSFFFSKLIIIPIRS